MRGLYRRKRMWWVRFTPIAGGERVRVSTGEHDEAAAIVAARKIIERATKEMRVKVGSVKTEIELYAAAKLRDGCTRATVESRVYVLRSVAADCRAETPAELTRDALQRWFDRRRARQAHTAAAYLNQIKWFLDWLVDRGRLPVNHAAGVKVPAKLPMRARRRFLTPEEARALLEACDQRPEPRKRGHEKRPPSTRTMADPALKFVIFCALHAGLRKLEIIEARRSWFDLEAGLLHVQKTDTFTPKDRDHRTIPLTEEFAQFLRGYVKTLPAGAVYMLAPRAAQGRARYRFDFRKRFEAVAQQCGLEDLTFHDLRRTFASLLVSRGVSIYKVARWLGDLVEVVERSYGHLLPQDADINASWR